MDIDESPSAAMVGQLFLEVGNPENDDMSGPADLEEQDARYRQALATFLDQSLEIDSYLVHPDVPLLEDIARKVLECPNSLRLAFIRGISDMALGPQQPHWGMIQRAYIAYVQWVLHGRIESDLANATGADSPGDYRRRPREINPDQLSHCPATVHCCNHCGRWSTRVICERGCQLQVGPNAVTIATRYCSADCRRLDLPYHIPACAQQGKFIRSVYFMMQFLNVVGANTSALVAKTCEEKQGITVVTEKPRYVDAMLGRHFLGGFDRSAFHTRRQAIMAFQDDYSSELGYVLGPLKEWLWRDLVSYIEEVTILVKNVLNPLLRIHPDDTKTFNILEPHTILRVTLKTDAVFAVDLSAGRFGWAEYVMPWRDFEHQRIWTILSITPSTVSASRPVVSESIHLPEVSKIHYHRTIFKFGVEHCREVFRTYYGANLDILDVACLDGTEFQRLLRLIEAVMGQVCQDALGELPLRHPYGRLYPTPEFELRVTCQRVVPFRLPLSSLWVTQDRAELLEEMTLEQLKMIWVDRLERLGGT
ncbi:hypothetical protein F5Y04DRAFT_291640 [Hypomontagnella monticulosa]|nr:hypothetical protein F5Y04DRAFT_291640 [Hypomontagnella monticulosa]